MTGAVAKVVEEFGFALALAVVHRSPVQDVFDINSSHGLLRAEKGHSLLPAARDGFQDC